MPQGNLSSLCTLTGWTLIVGPIDWLLTEAFEVLDDVGVLAVDDVLVAEGGGHGVVADAGPTALNQTARIDQIAKGHVRGPELEATGGRRYAVGDQVVMLTPDRDARWVTSERGTVTALEGGDGALTIGFGPKRTVTLAGTDIDDDHLDHAYAVTVHRTQGATVDTAHVLADGGGRELAYVAMSRARLTTHVHAVADDLDQACEDLARDWSTERRDRWIHDTDAPASEGDRLRPYVAQRPGDRVREHQTPPNAKNSPPSWTTRSLTARRSKPPTAASTPSNTANPHPIEARHRLTGWASAEVLAVFDRAAGSDGGLEEGVWVRFLPRRLLRPTSLR